ncbi:MAG: hypothetical protein RLZZ127_3100 [Planctomycetota bacterium]|jgi:PAS domain S-box-containing protein
MDTPAIDGAAALERAPAGCAITGPGGEVLLWNGAMARMTGVGPARILGRTLAEAFPAVAAPAVDGRLDAVRQAGTPALFSSRFAAPPGAAPAGTGRRHDLVVTRLVRDPLRLMWWLTDVTDLLERGERYRVALAKAEAESALRRERERELEQARAAAEAAAQAKSAFLATMSHELRTPLAGVIGMADILASMPMERTGRECIETIRTCADTLLAVINDVLDFSRAEAGGVQLETIPFAPAELLDDCLTVVAGRAQGKGLGLWVEWAEEPPARLAGDPARIRQILLNLLGNAVKFTETGTVHLRAEAGPDGLVVEVHDSGIGMDAAALARLFTPFTQAESSTTRRFGGTGLGLAIAHRLAALMGGGLTVASSPGAGSVFTLRLPLAALEPPAPPPELPGPILVIDPDAAPREALVRRLRRWGATVEGLEGPPAPGLAPPALALVALPAAIAHLGELRDLWGSATRIAVLAPLGAAWSDPDADAVVPLPLREAALRDLLAAPAAAAARTPAPAGTAPLVLMVDDNPVNRKVGEMVLRKAGYRVVLAEDGPAGIAAALAHRPDAILMDWQMPGMDGLEAARRLRRAWTGAPLPPILALTANTMPGDRERCLAAGLDDYLAKPYRADTLVEKLQYWLGVRGRA